MAVGYLNERTQKIITMILKGSSELTIKEIAAELSVSVRTVYNELDKADGWLAMKKLPLLRVIRGRVQPFLEEEKLALESALALETPKEDYIFTPGERVRIIVCQIMASDPPVYVEDLMNTCMVSRNTIFTDLQAVITSLHAYQLGIGYEKKRGYWIDGDTIRARALFFLYFSMLEPLFSAGKLGFIHMEEAEPYLKQIEQVERELKVSYVRNDMLALAVMIPIMERGEDQLYFSDVSIGKVKESREYGLVARYFPKLIEREKIYLTLHFLGGRLASCSGEEKTEGVNESLMEISRNLVAEFERLACVIFEPKDGLIQDLYRHIEASIYRYRFGIQIGNLMAEDIKREYPYIFDVVRQTAQYLEQQIGVQISDSEVSYLTLHFGAHLKSARSGGKELRILVVCMSGVATGNMISHELGRILPGAKIVGVAAASELVNPQNICDIIVSSVRLKALVPVIVVNPILNDFDRRNILNHPVIRGRFGFVDTDALFRVVKKYVPEERHRELRCDLDRFFAESPEEQPVLNPNVWRLTDFLTENKVLFLESSGRKRGEESQLQEEEKPWERAICAAAEPLLACGSIKKRYVEAIIARMVEAGPYMFVTKDLVLAHARPDDGVKHLDLSLAVAPEGIQFEHGKRARVILCLAAEDQTKHIGIIRDIRTALSKAAYIDELTRAADAQEVCEILRARLEKT